MNEDMFRTALQFAVKQARLITDDKEALEIKCLYKEWEVQIGRELAVGEYIQYKGQLFRVLQPHTVQSEWKPGIGTESLYVVIDKTHEGTIEDPIPAKTNMEYFNGKYYTENEILYLCIRDSGIALQFMPSQLVGNYFEIVDKESIENEGVEDDNENNSENGVEDDNENGAENDDSENNSENDNENENTESEGKDENIENEDTENTDKDSGENEIIAEEGTLESPIIIEDYSVGVNYEINKYYLVNEEIYLCIRDGLLYHNPNELLGNYFEKIN